MLLGLLPLGVEGALKPCIREPKPAGIGFGEVGAVDGLIIIFP
jgi:hypothetical protein